MSEYTDLLAARLTRLLNDPDLCADAVARLVSARAIFGHLDDALRSGGDLPARWTTPVPVAAARSSAR